MKNFPLLVCMEKSWLIHNHGVTPRKGIVAFENTLGMKHQRAETILTGKANSLEFEPAGERVSMRELARRILGGTTTKGAT